MTDKRENTSHLYDIKLNKIRPSLVPVEITEEIIKVWEVGTKKYGVDDWKIIVEKTPRVFLDACYRHIFAYQKGIFLDEEDNLESLAHAIVNLQFLLYQRLLSKQNSQENLTHASPFIKGMIASRRRRDYDKKI